MVVDTAVRERQAGKMNHRSILRSGPGNWFWPWVFGGFLSVILPGMVGFVRGADSWPEFRGPWGTGHATAVGNGETVGYPLHWGEGKNVVWKTPIPLVGLSSPVVLDGQVWLTTATEAGHDFYVLCVDAGSGEVLLNRKVFHSDHPESLGNGAGVNSYATPSPVIEPGRVYIHFGSFGTACLDTDSFEELWRRTDLPCRHYRGPASSPVLFGDLVILTMDGVDLQYLVGLDKRTGETEWKTDRSVEWNDEHIDRPMVRDGDWRKAHSTPLIAEAAGRTQMVSVGAKAAYGYDPQNGKELWRVEFQDWSAAPRPVIFRDHAIIATGFNLNELWSVRLDGAGEVTDTHVEWKIKRRVPRYASPLLVDDLVYLASDESFVSCIEAATGENVWTERVGGKFRASPIYADGRIYLFSLEGTTTVIKPGRTFEILATNVLEDGVAGRDDTRRGPGFMASPAAAGKAFYLRTRYHLYRIESGGSDPS